MEKVREEEANVAVRDEAQLQALSRNVQEATESARAAATEYDAATAQLDAVRAHAGGRLPPQEVAVVMVEAAGSQTQAAAGCAPWESAEEKEEDTEMMGRILEEGETADAGQRARTVEAVAGDQLVKNCNLCHEEATEDCKGGNCESCCESNRGTGPFQCCNGGYEPSDDESAAERLVVLSQDSSPPALAL